MKKRFSIVSSMALFFACVSLGFAQDQMPMRGPAMQRVEAFKKIRLMETLKFDEETSIRFFSRYNKHQEELRDIGQKRSGLVDQLQALGKSKASDAEIEKVIREIINLESKVAEARGKFVDELKGVLSVKQIAEYIVFERNFNQNLRELMREMTQERKGFQGPPR